MPLVACLLAHAEQAFDRGRRTFTHNDISFSLAVSSLGRLIVSDEHGNDLVSTFLAA